MISRRLITQGVRQLLADATGKPVGVMTVPTDLATGAQLPPPYTVLFPLEHSTEDATLADEHGTALSVYDAMFVSGPDPAVSDSRGTEEQVEWLADKGRAGVLSRAAGGGYANPLTVPGAKDYQREATEAGATSNPDDAIISYVIRFRFYLDSAT